MYWNSIYWVHVLRWLTSVNKGGNDSGFKFNVYNFSGDNFSGVFN